MLKRFCDAHSQQTAYRMMKEGIETSTRWSIAALSTS